LAITSIGFLLTLLSRSVRLAAPWDALTEFIGKFGEAVLIAGILAFALDRFLKRELLADAARGLFVHMLGFDQHPAVKTRLAAITFNTKLFISKKGIICILERTADGKVKLQVRMDWTIQNPTAERLPYPYGLAFERVERPAEASVTMICAGADQLQNTQEDPKEPGVWRLGGETEIPPDSSREFTAAYTIILPDDFYHDFATATPVMDTTLTVEAPEDLRVEVSRGHTDANIAAHSWRYANLFMPGERITLRWFRD
jgi:hypothetical protein